MSCKSNKYFGCRMLSWCSNNNDNNDEYLDTNYRPCEHIGEIIELLKIEERNEENDEKIREYLYDNCCNKQSYSVFHYLKQFIMKKILRR